MMNQNSSPEVWMRGPVEGVPALLQPVAHALLQMTEDVEKYIAPLDGSLLWLRPENTASVAFHIQHIGGVIDRMFTYADDRPLSEAQFDYLSNEGVFNPELTKDVLLSELKRRVAGAIGTLKTIDVAELGRVRFLGRKRIPTTLIGLLFHAAEHSQRHVGQLLVTARWVRALGATEAGECAIR
ncbi:MAG TPA: DinB family protein [Sphingobacterium sp.]|jgi:hypothetical protein|nr:DinB family protein [Sphingobacterium sp.]